MPRKRPIPFFTAYTGHAVDHAYIRTRLQAQRTEIARLLDIDLGSVEARRRIPPPRHPDDGPTTPFARIQEIREHPGVEHVAQVDVAIDEIADLAVRGCAAIVQAQAKPSAAQVYQALQTLSQMAEIPDWLVAQLEPSVGEILAENYPVDRVFFAAGHLQSSHVRAAAQRALAQRDKPGRGRPFGNANVLTGFVFDLVAIFNGWADRRATRRVARASTNAYGSDTQSIEVGRVNEFCERVVDALPSWAQVELKPPRTKVDRAVRDALKAHRDGTPP